MWNATNSSVPKVACTEKNFTQIDKVLTLFYLMFSYGSVLTLAPLKRAFSLVFLSEMSVTLLLRDAEHVLL